MDCYHVQENFIFTIDADFKQLFVWTNFLAPGFSPTKSWWIILLVWILQFQGFRYIKRFSSFFNECVDKAASFKSKSILILKIDPGKDKAALGLALHFMANYNCRDYFIIGTLKWHSIRTLLYLGKRQVLCWLRLL